MPFSTFRTWGVRLFIKTSCARNLQRVVVLPTPGGPIRAILSVVSEFSRERKRSLRPTVISLSASAKGRFWISFQRGQPCSSDNKLESNPAFAKIRPISESSEAKLSLSLTEDESTSETSGLGTVSESKSPVSVSETASNSEESSGTFSSICKSSSGSGGISAITSSFGEEMNLASPCPPTCLTEMTLADVPSFC